MWLSQVDATGLGNGARTVYTVDTVVSFNPYFHCQPSQKGNLSSARAYPRSGMCSVVPRIYSTLYRPEDRRHAVIHDLHGKF